MSRPPLTDRFAESMERLGVGSIPRRLLVAFSGGLDSTVLLHLLRFGPVHRLHRIVAAHFDHRMRATSGDDAEWAAKLCASWDVELRSGRAEVPPEGESAARTARYAFLRRAAQEIGADWILTAHHADDQAETVLFRVLRGTGLAGLRGIPPRRSGLLRPLLPFWREELEAYARDAGLLWAEDPTNREPRAARNRLRTVIIPMLEREIAPGARRSLVTLSELAAENEEAWRHFVERLLTDAVIAEEDGFSIEREAFRRAGPALAARALRELLKRLEITPDRVGTRSALQFITEAPSGRKMTLSSGILISLEFDRAVLRRTPSVREDEPLILGGAPPGEAVAGRLLLGGRSYAVWLRPADTEPAPDSEGGWRVGLPPTTAFPITLRGRRSGDRIRTRSGTRTLKRLMIDRKVPLRERSRLPVLVDANGEVLWAAGLASSSTIADAPAELVLEVAPHGG